MAFVEFKNVVKQYQMGEVTIKASDGVDFEIEKGEFVVIVGASGAGKTTILNMLGGMDTCDSGKIIVDGRNIAEFNRRQFTEYRRYDIGFVFQFYNLVTNLTAKENVELSVQICPDALDPSEVLKNVGLQERENNFPSQLSGGEQQRVALARALVNDPQLIIADEPTGNIDPALSYEIVGLLKGINECGTTILMVTHEHDLVRSFGGRIININKGNIAFDEFIGGSYEGK